ncbi:MAG TPA: K+/H+ antiporter subunit F [Casimicrobiaceae bacterium]|jgi:multicomponent K+:H+ antiporter subunit F|nr:K+/H+ antiporter subunit F [Casimicrobiaceae bacterium]
MTPVLSFAIFATLTAYAVAMALAVYRLLRGPGAEDRVLALDFLYVNGMLALLVLGIRYASGMVFEAALVIAIAGGVSSAALAKFLLRGEAIE